MKKLLVLIFLCSSFLSFSQIDKSKMDSVLGTWVIDLRPTPDSEPYIKEFKITKISGKEFEGEFYGTAFTGGFLNTDWDK